MPGKISCKTHGEADQAFLCEHLTSEAHGLGFNRDGESDEDPFPDAWCDNCEIIRATHGDWNDDAQELVNIILVCSGCYEHARIRNTCPSVTFDDLTNLRWKCATCEEWHHGPCLDFGVSRPYYWTKDHDKASRWVNLIPRNLRKPAKTFLDSDYCAIDDENFFVRGLIHLPIIGTAESLRWGVWGSLKRDNFNALLKADKDPARVEFPPMFSWLSSRLSDYPDTLGLKMRAHVQEPGMRPHFELELSDHPLSQEFHHGISPERVKEIMFRSLKDCGEA